MCFALFLLIYNLYFIKKSDLILRHFLQSWFLCRDEFAWSLLFLPEIISFTLVVAICEFEEIDFPVIVVPWCGSVQAVNFKSTNLVIPTKALYPLSPILAAIVYLITAAWSSAVPELTTGSIQAVAGMLAGELCSY